MKNQKKLQLRKSFQITPSFSTNLLGTFLIPGLFFLGIFQFWQLFARRKKIQSDGPPVSGVEASAGPACRREQGKSTTRADRTQRCRALLKARLFRPGRSERGRLSPHRHRLIHASETSSTPPSTLASRSLLPFHRLHQSHVNPKAPLGFAAAEEVLVAGHLGSSFGATAPSSSSTTMPRCPLA
jgi:hypothetical protein